MNDVQKGYKKDDLDHESQVVKYKKIKNVRSHVEPKIIKVKVNVKKDTKHE